MTYRVDGVQYVAVMAAWGGGGYQFVPRYSAAYRRGNQGRLLVFKLGGGDVPIPPDLPPLDVAPAPPPQLPEATPATVADGQVLYFRYCAACHTAQHRSITPDLRRMQAGIHAAFESIVLGGALVPRGMPRWDDVLTPDDARAIHAYLIDQQARTRADEVAKREAGVPIDAPSQAVMSSF
jgi:quinohemoprotein ethanol dehydrogenase